jgi:hypothetical protein
MPDDSICDIEFDGDDVWIGMWSGGMGRYTRSDNTVALFRAGRVSYLLCPRHLYRRKLRLGRHLRRVVHVQQTNEPVGNRRSQAREIRCEAGRTSRIQDVYCDARHGTLVSRRSHGQFNSFFDLSKTSRSSSNTTAFSTSVRSIRLVLLQGQRIQKRAAGSAGQSYGIFDGKLWVGTYGQVSSFSIPLQWKSSRGSIAPTVCLQTSSNPSRPSATAYS